MNKVEEAGTRILIIRQSEKALIVELLIFCVPLAIAYIVASLLLSSFFPGINSELVSFTLFIIVLGIISMIILVQKRRWKTREYTITPSTISVKESVFSDDCVSYNTKGIVAIDAHQSVFSKALGYGDITLHFMGGSTACLRNIPDPNECMEAMREIVLAKKPTAENSDQIS